MTDSWERTRLDHRAQQSEAIASAALSLMLDRGAPALTMAAIAIASGVSRQTLYRYYSDVDAVLVGVAEFIGSRDHQFEAEVLQHSDPVVQLDAIVRAVAHAGNHDTRDSAALRSSLPPKARQVLAQHEDRILQVLEDVLTAGIRDGVFRADIGPSGDAPLILGLAAAAEPATTERAIALIHRIVDPNTKEPQK